MTASQNRNHLVRAGLALTALALAAPATSVSALGFQSAFQAVHRLPTSSRQVQLHPFLAEPAVDGGSYERRAGHLGAPGSSKPLALLIDPPV